MKNINIFKRNMYGKKNMYGKNMKPANKLIAKNSSKVMINESGSRVGKSALFVILKNILKIEKHHNELHHKKNKNSYEDRNYKIMNIYNNDLITFTTSQVTEVLQYDLFKHMKNNNYKSIILKRRNLLEQYLSSKFAELTGLWGEFNLANDNIKVKSKINIDKDDFIDFKNQITYSLNLFIENLKKNNIPFIILNYEDIYAVNLESKIAKLKEILEFLDYKEPVDFNQFKHEVFFSPNIDNKLELYKKYFSNLDEILNLSEEFIM